MVVARRKFLQRKEQLDATEYAWLVLSCDSYTSACLPPS
jgi:hypothetical protein